MSPHPTSPTHRVPMSPHPTSPSHRDPMFPHPTSPGHRVPKSPHPRPRVTESPCLRTHVPESPSPHVPAPHVPESPSPYVPRSLVHESQYPRPRHPFSDSHENARICGVFRVVAFTRFFQSFDIACLSPTSPYSNGNTSMNFVFFWIYISLHIYFVCIIDTFSLGPVHNSLEAVQKGEEINFTILFLKG